MKLNILITAGPTREYIDPVRFLSNASSGKMGYAIGAAAKAAGHKVVLISGPVSLPRPRGIKFVRVVSAAQMASEVKKRFAAADIFFSTAAVADYRPAQTLASKLKKSRRNLTLKLHPTEDILAYLGAHKKSQVLVGFALETKDLIKSAREKLSKKNLDLIAANYPEAIGVDRSSVWLVNADDDIQAIKNAEKKKIAKRIIDEAVRIFEARRAR
jgi:phosphopantothenoylcysteine synthetase/decarboxylase